MGRLSESEMAQRNAVYAALDDDLKPFVHPSSWRPGFEMFFEAASAGAFEGDRIRRAALAGLDINVRWSNTEPFELERLSDAADVIRGLEIESRTPMRGASVLAGMRALERLTIDGVVQGSVDLSGLPRLRQFSGGVARSTRSVFENENLRDVMVERPLKTPVVVKAPVEELMVFGARASSAEVVLQHPDALRVYTRKFCRGGFDLRALEASPGLRSLKIMDFDEVRGLRVLTRLRELQCVYIGGGRVVEPWSELFGMTAPEVYLYMQPVPRNGTLEKMAALGWNAPRVEDLDWADADMPRAVAGPVRVDGEDGVLLTVDVAEAVALVSERERRERRWGSDELEREVARIAAFSGPDGGAAAVEFDSEGDMVAASFAREDDALRVARVLATWIELPLEEH